MRSCTCRTNNNIIEQQTIKINQAGGKSYVLASVVHKHPKFSMDNPSGDNDIAILKVKNCRRTSPNINLYKFENLHLLLNYLHIVYIYINLRSCPRTSPSLTRSNQHAFPVALQKTTAVGSKRVLTDFKNILLGKAASVSGWGGTKAYEPLTFVNQPRQCGLKEGIVNILKTTDKKCENFLGDSTTTT